MKQTRDILSQLEKIHDGIDYYFAIIDKIEESVNNQPDIAIESCKALFEGISKFIWKQIDPAYVAKKADKMDFQPLVRDSMNKLGELHEDIEIDFLLRLNSLIHCIGEIRNKRGDISHGKLAPKAYLSSSQFSNLVVIMSDSMLYYILHCFSEIPFIKKLEYKDNHDFNEKLDNEKPLDFVSYSKALFDQDIEAYKQELLDYRDELTMEED